MGLDLEAEARRLRQEDRRRWFEERCGEEPWFTAWQYVHDDDQMGWLSCYLVPAGEAAAQLTAPEYGRVAHEFSPSFDDSVEPPRYDRLGNDDGYEPLVLRRYWHGLHPEQTEVVEEFRLFHNLFPIADGSLGRLTDHGTADETVVRIAADGAVEFRLAPLLQYLAAKQCALVACIDWRIHAHARLDDLGAEEGSETYRGERRIYSLGFGDLGFPHSRLLGKKVIEPPPVERSGLWPYEREEEERYPEFIIGVDERGDEVSYSCDPDGLGTYFDRDPDPSVPHYLTPVHFRRDVLERYFALPERFRVRDGMLSCGDLWSLQIDNDHETHVVVYLGDLGRDLPNAERPHWRLHNVAPEGLPQSETSARRNLLAQFTDPTSPDLVFPQRLRELNDRWEARFGWPLFKPLPREDADEAHRLRIPLSDSEPALDEQVRTLSKLTIESINPRIRELAPPPAEGQPRGSILTLHAALVNLGVDESLVGDRVTGLLGALHALNNGVRHGKGDDWRRAADTFGIRDRPRPEAFRDILERMLAAFDLILTETL